MPLYTPPSNAIPTAGSATLATAGTAGTYARGDHAHPRYTPDATDHGYSGWTYDVALTATSYQLSASGTISVCKVNVPLATTVTNISMYVSAIGVTLTAGQSFVALYGPSKNLLSQSADQAAAWVSNGLKTMALSVAQAITPGTYYVAFWSNGSTMPSFRSGINSISVNSGLSGETSRWATADTGITTTAPATLGAFTALAACPWAALS